MSKEYKSHNVFSRMASVIEDALTSRGISHLLASLMIFHLFLFLTVIVHETGHILVAKHYGCEAGIAQIMGFTGASGVECPDETPMSVWVQIAYAGPLISFLLGLWLWFLEPDGRARIGGLIAFMFSTLPNLAWWIPNSDAYVAVTNFSFIKTNAMIIYFSIGSIIAYLILREITERKWFLEPSSEKEFGV